MSKHSPSIRSPLGTAMTVLLLAGVGAGWLAGVALVEASAISRDAEGYLQMTEVKTPLYYAAHGLGIICVTGAGILAALKGRFRAFGFGSRMALAVLMVTSAAWALAAYGPGELLTKAAFDATGPFVWWTVILVAAGAEEMVWPYLDRLVRWLSFATALLAVMGMATAGEYAYYKGFSKFLEYAIVLTYLGGWTLLTSAAAQGWKLVRAAVPWAVLIVTALYAQGRSWLVTGLLVAIAFAVIRARELGSRRDLLRIALAGSALVALGAILVVTGGSSTLAAAADGLVNRLSDDTRSGQYVDFFASVPVTDLILGRGPKGTWFWVGEGKFQFFDNGYLWTLFIGGVPTLLSYAVVVLLPGARALRRGVRGWDAAAAVLVLLWALACSGLSTFVLPGLTLPSYLALLYAGRCHLALARTGSQESLFNPTPSADLA